MAVGLFGREGGVWYGYDVRERTELLSVLGGSQKEGLAFNLCYVAITLALPYGRIAIA